MPSEAAEILSAWRTVVEDVNGLATERTPLSTAVPRLLGAVEAALKFHERHPLYGNASTDDEPGACPHDPDAPEHFEDADEPGKWLCLAKFEADACSGCTGTPDGEYADWPCPEYEAILAALKGEGDHAQR